MCDKELLLNKILIIIFALIIILPFGLFKITGEIDLGRFYEEKRLLASLPQKLESDYLKKIMVFVNDHAPYRKTSITLVNIFNQKSMELYDEYIGRRLSAYFVPDWYKETDEYKQNIPFYISSYHPHVIYGKEDWLFMRNLNCLKNYKGQNLPKESQMLEWKNLYEKLDGYCNQRGIKLAFMIAPNKSQVFSEFMPPYKIINMRKREILFKDYLEKNSRINFIYPVEELKKANYIRYTYYKNDSHWNYFGCFIATNALYKKLGIPLDSLEQLKITETEKFEGDLSDICGYMKSYIDYNIDYKPDLKSYKMEKAGFIYSCSVAKKDSNGRKIVVIGDSYMSYFIPFIGKDFYSSKFFHLRSMADKELKMAINELGKDDVLFLESSERYDEKEHFPTVKYLIKLFE